jgi:hypothetical protein
MMLTDLEIVELAIRRVQSKYMQGNIVELAFRELADEIHSLEVERRKYIEPSNQGEPQGVLAR